MNAVADVLDRSVDLVRDAGCELADRLELLGVPDLRFQRALLGDVGAQDQETRLPTVVVDRSRRDPEESRLAVRVGERNLGHALGAAVFERLMERRGGLLGSPGDRSLDDRAAEGLLRNQPEAARGRHRVPEHDLALGVEADHHGGDRLEYGLGLGSACPDGVACVLQRRHELRERTRQLLHLERSAVVTDEESLTVPQRAANRLREEL